MDNPASPPVQGAAIDFGQPLELVSDEGTSPVTLCAADRLPHFVEANPDHDGDFWLVRPDGSRFCVDAAGDATPWGVVRNIAQPEQVCA